MIEIYSINHNIPNTKENWTNRCKRTLKSKINQIKKNLFLKQLIVWVGSSYLGWKFFQPKPYLTQEKK